MKKLEQTSDASAAAEFFGRCMMDHHRGVFDCGDSIVIYGNDGYTEDRRSQREVDLLVERLTHLEILEPEFGVDSEGVTWSLLIRNYRQDDIPVVVLNDMAWESWFIACDEQLKNKAV